MFLIDTNVISKTRKGSGIGYSTLISNARESGDD